MTEERKDTPRDDAPETPETPVTEEATSAEAAEQTADESTLSVDMESLKTEAENWKQKYLRTMADMENMRKRTAKEIEDAKKFGMTSFAREMLTVQDNLERAMEAMRKEQSANDDATKNMVEGVEMISKQLGQAFEKAKIQKIDAVGSKFDPQLHEAMFEVPTSEHAPGTVVQEVQTGYVIGDRLLRPAMVGTAKAPQGAAADDVTENKDAPGNGTNG